MKTHLGVILIAALSAQASFAEGARSRRGSREAAPPVINAQAAVPAGSAQTLPPLPEGIAQLKFSEIFKTPIGNYGPEFSDKAKSLDGKKIRILGYMVKEDTSPDNCNPIVTSQKRPSWMSSVIPGRIMFTPEPVAVSMSHYALCDDLPVQTLFVTVPDRFGEHIPHVPGLILLTGTLSIGNKAEPEGRISAVRMILDPTSDANQNPNADGNDHGNEKTNTLSMSNPQPEINK